MMTALLTAPTASCTPYWLVCDAQLGRPERTIAFDDLRDSVATATHDFGYELVGTDERATSRFAEFQQTGRMRPAFAALKGARARVDLGLGQWAGKWIAIQDFDNRKETEFVRALRERIQQQLEADFGIDHDCFKRQWSPFAP
jgi:hypothetical protein